MQSFTEKLRRLSTSPGKVAKRILRRSNVFSGLGSVRRKRKSLSNEYISFTIPNDRQKIAYCGNKINSSNTVDRKPDISRDLDVLEASFVPIERLLSKSSLACSSSYTPYVPARDFISLPDRCLLQVLDKLNINDICNLRLVNKRLNLVVQRHSAVLPRKHCISMAIFGTTTGLIDFERPLEKRSTEASVKSSSLDKALRHIVVERCLYVEGVLFDTVLRHAIQRSQCDCLYEINFNNCHMNVSSKEMASFLAHTGLQKLSIENCSFETDTTIADEIFTYHNYIHTFSILSDKLQILPALTCNTLVRWSTNENWPVLIALDNVQCSFDIPSIVKMIKSYIRQCYSDSADILKNAQSILWNFGLVNVSIADAKVALKAIGPCVNFLKSKDSFISLYVQCQDSAPPLIVRFRCVNIFANI